MDLETETYHREEVEESSGTWNVANEVATRLRKEEGQIGPVPEQHPPTKLALNDDDFMGHNGFASTTMEAIIWNDSAGVSG